MIGHSAVKIITTQSRIAASGQHLKHTRLQAQNGHIECTTTQIEHHKLALGFLIKPIGHSSGGGLVNQAQYVQARKLCCVFGGLALRVVKIRRHCNNSAHQFTTQGCFGTFAQVAQNIGRHFHWAFGAVIGLNFNHAARIFYSVWQVQTCYILKASAHQAFDRKYGVEGVGVGTGQGIFAHVLHARFTIAHHAGQNNATRRIGQTFGTAASHAGHQRMRGAQVDAHSKPVFVRRSRHAGFGNL